MDLKQYTHELIYEGKYIPLTDSLEQFKIVCPEYAPHETEIKPYPLPASEHIFALIWEINPKHIVSATIRPSEPHFIYSKEFTPGMRTQMHSHEYLELFYIIDGEYRQKILGNEYVFHKGELCLIDRNCQHQEILGEKPAAILFLGITNIMFDDVMEKQVSTERISSFLKTALLKQKSLQQYLHFKPLSAQAVSVSNAKLSSGAAASSAGSENASSLIESTLMQLLTELERHDEASPYICQGLLLRIFYILSTQYDFSISQKLRHEMNGILFDEITKFINENLAGISIASLADEFHFQEDYFNRLLKTRTGLTYTEYLQQCRLKKAAELLRSTSYSIDYIMELIGYHNKGYFYRIFHEQYKLTPAKYRAEHKAKATH